MRNNAVYVLLGILFFCWNGKGALEEEPLSGSETLRQFIETRPFSRCFTPFHLANVHDPSRYVEGSDVQDVNFGFQVACRVPSLQWYPNWYRDLHVHSADPPPAGDFEPLSLNDPSSKARFEKQLYRQLQYQVTDARVEQYYGSQCPATLTPLFSFHQQFRRSFCRASSILASALPAHWGQWQQYAGANASGIHYRYPIPIVLRDTPWSVGQYGLLGQLDSPNYWSKTLQSSQNQKQSSKHHNESNAFLVRQTLIQPRNPHSLPISSSWAPKQPFRAFIESYYRNLHDDDSFSIQDETFAKHQIPFQDMLLQLVSPPQDEKWLKYFTSSLSGSTNDSYSFLSNQFPLFSLHQNVTSRPSRQKARQSTIDPSRRVYETNVFGSQKGVIVPAHTDCHDNFLLQVVSTKLVFLFPPDVFAGALSPHSVIHPSRMESLRQLSQDYSYHQKKQRGWHFRLATKSGYFNHGTDSDNSDSTPIAHVVRLEPGDVLFIPHGWAHYIFVEDDYRHQSPKKAWSDSLSFAPSTTFALSTNTWVYDDFGVDRTALLNFVFPYKRNFNFGAKMHQTNSAYEEMLMRAYLSTFFESVFGSRRLPLPVWDHNSEGMNDWQDWQRSYREEEISSQGLEEMESNQALKGSTSELSEWLLSVYSAYLTLDPQDPSSILYRVKGENHPCFNQPIKTGMEQFLQYQQRLAQDMMTRGEDVFENELIFEHEIVSVLQPLVDKWKKWANLYPWYTRYVMRSLMEKYLESQLSIEVIPSFLYYCMLD